MLPSPEHPTDTKKSELRQVKVVLQSVQGLTLEYVGSLNWAPPHHYCHPSCFFRSGWTCQVGRRWVFSSSQDCCWFGVKKAAWPENWHWRLEKVEGMQLIVVEVELVAFLVDMLCMLLVKVDTGKDWQL